VVILHAFLALLAGFATMAIVVIVVTALLKQLAPQWIGVQGSPRPAYVLVNLGYSFCAAAAGGFVTAWAASESPLTYVLALAVAILVLGAITALQARGQQPASYQIALLIISPFGVLAGGLLRLKVVGYL
jgi:hypothetical protein